IRNNTGTNTFTESTAAAGYYLMTSVGNTTTNNTFNITGVSNTEGNVVYVVIVAHKTTGTTATVQDHVQINGSQIGNALTTTTTNDQESWIAMYINGAWRIIGYGNTSSSTTQDTADYAEWIPYAGDSQPQPGDVLTIDS